MNMVHLQTTIMEMIKEQSVSYLAIRMEHNDEILYEQFVSPDGQLDSHTLFDIASVTKMVVTTSLALIALDKGLIHLEDPVSRYFDCPPDKEAWTIRHLLTHTIGYGHKSLCEGDPADVAGKILHIPCDIPVGSDVLYSCPGFILLGKLLEKVYGAPLNVLFKEKVATPLGMNDSVFLPKGGAIVNSNQDEADRGKVNDYNCRYLGGVAGNAGLFSHMDDMSRFVKMLRENGHPLFSEKMFLEAVRNYTPGMSESRGLGFTLVDECYKQTGGLFPVGAIGHCGHTGQSVFLDRATGFSVIVLSDMTASVTRKFGFDKYGVVMHGRERLHAAIKEDMKANRFFA